MDTLYYYPGNASFAPHVVLRELELPFRLQLVDRERSEQRGAAYGRLNALGRIPTLVRGDIVIAESAAICLFLAEQAGGRRLLGDGSPAARASLLQWLMFLTNTLQPALMAFHYPDTMAADAQSRMDVQRTAAAAVERSLHVVNEVLAGRAHLAGPDLTVCDFFFLMLARWARTTPTTARQFHRIDAVLTRLAERESVRAAAQGEGLDLPLF
jgi:glutathione S-transferase